MKSLMEFAPKWIGLLRPKSGEGIELVCPVCGPTHHLIAYFANPLDGKEAAAWQEPKWIREGETFETLTVAPSIQYPCFHGWIENGQVIDVSESPLTIFIPGKGLVALSPKQVTDMMLSEAQQEKQP